MSSKTKSERKEIARRKTDKLRETHHFYAGSFKLPGKIEEDYNKRLDQTESKEEWLKLLKEQWRKTSAEGYWKPTSSSKTKQAFKKISRKKFRAKTRQELLKEPEDIGSKKGSDEDKEFDYKWSID